jgi:hypothetical protein
MVRKLVLAFCITRLILATALAVAGTPDSLAENITLRVMCAVLGGSRSSRQSDQFGGLSAALETVLADGSQAGQPA